MRAYRKIKPEYIRNIQTFITAHNGANGTADDSLESVCEALRSGAEIIEVDVRMAEGVLLLSHDEIQSGEAAERVTLEKAFGELKKYPAKINCDLKTEGLMLPVLSLAGRAGVRDRILFTGSVTKKELAGVPSDCGIFANIEYFGGTENPKTITQTVKKELSRFAACGINISYKMLTQELYTVCREEGIPISVWTVNRKRLLKRFLEYDLFNITTRKPSAAVRLREARNKGTKG